MNNNITRWIAVFALGWSIGNMVANVKFQRENDRRANALAAAIIAVDGGNGDINKLLGATADCQEHLKRVVRSILDENKPPYMEVDEGFTQPTIRLTNKEN